MLSVRPKLFYIRNQINPGCSAWAPPKQPRSALGQGDWGGGASVGMAGSPREAAGWQDAINTAACSDGRRSVAADKTLLLQKKRELFH